MTKDFHLDLFFDFFQQNSRKLAAAASVGFVVLISLSVANTALFIVENLDDRAGIAATGNKPEVTTRKNSKIDLSSLNLFGRVRETGTPQIVDAPETKLNLELQGVFISQNETASSAIVSEKNKAGELFHIGDSLPGNAVLSAVFNDHILIRRGSRTEKLMFSDSNLRPHTSSSTPRLNGRRNTSAVTNRLQQVRERIAQRTRNAGRPVASHRASGSPLRIYMDKNRDKIQQDPQAVLAELGISPVSEGNAKGYRLSGSVSQTSLMQAGLQQGDIILSVNGKAVGDVMSDGAFIDQAMASKRVRVEVQRGARRFFLTVPIP